MENIIIKDESENKKEKMIFEIGITIAISIFLLIIYSDTLAENIGISHILIIIGLGIVVNPLQKKILINWKNRIDKKFLANIAINFLITIFTCVMLDILHFFNVMVFVSKIPNEYKIFFFILLYIIISMSSKIVIKIYKEKKVDIDVIGYSYLLGILSFFIYEYYFNLIVENNIMYSTWKYIVYRISIIGGLVLFWIFFLYILKKIILKIKFEKILMVLVTLIIAIIIGVIIIVRTLSLFYKLGELF